MEDSIEPQLHSLLWDCESITWPLSQPDFPDTWNEDVDTYLSAKCLAHYWWFLSLGSLLSFWGPNLLGSLNTSTSPSPTFHFAERLGWRHAIRVNTCRRSNSKVRFLLQVGIISVIPSCWRDTPCLADRKGFGEIFGMRSSGKKNFQH